MKGAAWGLGIELVAIGPSICMDAVGFERLKVELSKRPPPCGAKRKRPKAKSAV